MPGWIEVLGGVVVVGLAGWVSRGFFHGKELSRLNQRASLGNDELYSQYYATSGLSKDSILEIWNEIATTLELPPEKLRPSDRFGDDIGLYFMTSDHLDTLAELGEKRARTRGINVQFENLATVDDFIKALAEKT